MWKKIAPATFLFSVALNMAFLVLWGASSLRGQPGTAPEQPQQCYSEHQLYRQIGVSEEQWKELRLLLADFARARCGVCLKLDRARAELIDTLEGPDPDFGQIRLKQDEIAAAQRQMQDLVVRQLLREKEVLTPEQQEQVFNFFRKCCQCPEGSSSSEEGCGQSGDGSSCTDASADCYSPVW